jgi:hypothetical protein
VEHVAANSIHVFEDCSVEGSAMHGEYEIESSRDFQWGSAVLGVSPMVKITGNGAQKIMLDG